MNRFAEGDRVRIDIPDQGDPDHDRYHGQEGVVGEVIEDQAAMMTGDSRDSVIYRVELEDEITDFRWRDLRPA